jgi:sulfide dehydrogenase cytochrome subunit
MANNSTKLALLAGAAALGLSTATLAADAAAPAPELMSGASARMLSETCAGCHGTDGASVGPAIPTIAGMNGEYFVELMQGYKKDEVYGTIMNRIAKGYTEEEIALMATFFAGKKFVAAKQEFDEGLTKTGLKLHDKYCEKCHSEGGKILEDEEYYILAGQWTPYLKNAMADFMEERREMPKKMKKKLDKLIKKEGDAGLEALFAYYASEQ